VEFKELTIILIIWEIWVGFWYVNC